MNDELTNVRTTKAQRNALGSELIELKNQLKTNIEFQERAILEGKDPVPFETDIVHLRTRIQGIEKALKSLDVILKQMSEEEAIRLREKKLEQIKQARAECLELLAGIYLLFAEITKQMIAFKAKHGEYRVLSRGIKQEINLLNKTGNFIHSFNRKFMDLLAAFPAEIFKDGNLPTRDALEKSLRR